MVNFKISKLLPELLARLLLSANDATNTSHFLISARPLSNECTSCERIIVSQYIFEKICKQALKDQAEEMRRLYNMIQSNPTTSTVTGMLFKHQVHQFLQEGNAVTLFPIHSHLPSQGKLYHYNDYTATDTENGEVLTLLKLEEHIFVEETGFAPKIRAYYCPQRTNFPTIDSFTLMNLPLRNPPS